MVIIHITSLCVYTYRALLQITWMENGEKMVLQRKYKVLVPIKGRMNVGQAKTIKSHC